MEDAERCYRAVQSRDARFDGWFFTAVRTTRIYCRPSCPARTPKAENVTFYATAAAAQQAGYRACLRCRPDAAPGSPEWLGRADVAARAVRLVFDGVVDRQGVAGLARRLGYGERQLHRVLVAEVGTGALSLARAQRAQTARVLVETTDLTMAQVAFAAGFASIRQFNDTVRAVFDRTPTELRAAGQRRSRRHGDHEHRASSDTAQVDKCEDLQRVTVRLARRSPFAADALFAFLAKRAVAGLEEYDGTHFRRTLSLPHGHGWVDLSPGDDHIVATFGLTDLRDLTTAIARSRHLCNLDADPVAVDEVLSADPDLAPLVERSPGLRVPGSVDGFETAVRAIIGQQISVAGARTVTASLVRASGQPLVGGPLGTLTHVFPDPAGLQGLVRQHPEDLSMPTQRRAALGALATAVSTGALTIDPATTTDQLTAAMVPLAGVGPWTAGYVALRALGDPDAFLVGDLGVRRGARAVGLPDDPPGLAARAEAWRPWRAYALMHLWSAAAATTVHRSNTDQGESAA